MGGVTHIQTNQVDDAASAFEGLNRLHLIMGLQCNVRCTMCYQTDFSPKFNMPAVLYKEKLRDAYPHVRSVKLQGGEPTIMKNCREAAELLSNYPDIKLTVITNGVFIDDFWHEAFVERGGNVNVSINAGTEATYDKIVIHGEWGRVIRNLERLLANRRGKTPTVGVTAVILKENFHELHTIIELASKMGIDYIEFLVDPILSFAGLPTRQEVAAELTRCQEAQAKSGIPVDGLSDFGSKFALPIRMEGKAAHSDKPMCRAPFYNLVIDWNGDVRVCCNTWVRMGNLYKADLREIWNNHPAQKFRRKMEKGDYLWCSPNCSDNAAPTKLSLAHKYVYELCSDPENFTKKVDQKIRQVRGKWLAVRQKRSRPLADPKRVRLAVIGATAPPNGQASTEPDGGCNTKS